jgi:multicomponent Na+:H+ antiporter subunit E
LVHPISLGIALYLLWIVLSGYFQPLLLMLGVVSTLIVLFIALRMEVVDRESHPVHLTLRLPLWSPSLPISPTVFQVPTSQKSQLGQVVYANSITLTPGTVSMTLENNQVRVHALTEDIAKDLQTGTMDRRVTALEGEG